MSFGSRTAHCAILEFVKDGKDTDILQTKTLKGEDIEVSLIQCRGPERYVDIQSVERKSETKLVPPRSIRTLTLAHIIRLQREDEQCAKVINHLLTVSKEKQETLEEEYYI